MFGTLDVDSVFKNTGRPLRQLCLMNSVEPSVAQSVCVCGRKWSGHSQLWSCDGPDVGRVLATSTRSRITSQKHNPLASAGELSKHHDAFILEEFGHGPVADVLRREHHRLRKFHGHRGIQPLCREGKLYTYCCRRAGKLEMAPAAENQDIVMDAPGNTSSEGGAEVQGFESGGTCGTVDRWREARRQQQGGAKLATETMTSLGSPRTSER